MEYKLSDKMISTNILDLIDPSDKVHIEEFLPFLKCYKCHEIMVDPKFCVTCNLNVCIKCKPGSCDHPAIQSRHLKYILETMNFKCKFSSKGCMQMLKYLDIRSHLVSCKHVNYRNIMQGAASGNVNLSNSLFSNSSLLNSGRQNNLGSNNNPGAFTTVKKAAINEDKFKMLVDVGSLEGKINVQCIYCKNDFSNKKQFIEHSKACFPSDNKSDDLIANFSQNYENIRNLYYEMQKEKIHDNVKDLTHHLNEFYNKMNNKISQNEAAELKITKFLTDEFIKEDEAYIQLEIQEQELEKKKNELALQLKKKIEEYRYHDTQQEKSLMNELGNYKNITIQLEMEEKWLKEEIESSVFEAAGEKCAKCGSEDNNVKKFFCQECRGKYCIEKCAIKCKNQTCPKGIKYMCPRDTKKCSLCHKSNYCESCKKACFFVDCSNQFCPECYKKNEHQTRNQNINCKFFTCEKDQVCDCLMTSLFCSKCEKRLCNKCIMKDVEHFPFLA